MLRLRQIALVAADLAAAGEELSTVLGLGEAYRDEGVAKYGLHNLVFPLARGFLEIVSPTAPEASAGRLLTKRGGDGGYMVILQTDDLEAARRLAAAAGARVVDQQHRATAVFTHYHPKDVGGAILSIDWMEPPDHWEWAGPGWRERVRGEAALVSAELQADDPRALASRWSQVLGRPAAPTAAGYEIALDEGRLAFVKAEDGRGEGLGGFGVSVSDPLAVERSAAARGIDARRGVIEICGARVRIGP